MIMDNVTFIEVENIDGSTTTHAIIDKGNGEFTSMPKATYDAMIEQQAAMPKQEWVEPQLTK